MRPGFIILFGALAVLGLSVVCVLREAPAIEQPHYDGASAVAPREQVAEPQTVAMPEAEPETSFEDTEAPVLDEFAVRERQIQTQSCQRRLDALMATERINFEVLSAAIKVTSQPLLDQLVEVLRQYPDIRIEIGGHTDGKGIAELNKELSKARSQSVRNFLIQQGIAQERLIAIGYGSTQPIADDQEEEGRMQNRRIEFKVEGIQQ